MCVWKRALWLLVVGLGCSWGAGGQAGDSPKIVLSQESWDFGKVWHPESQFLALIVRNEGRAELKITNVQSSCGCTVIEPGRKEVPAGESTEIKIRFDTQGKQDAVHSTVTIESNDPVRPKIQFPVSGFVKRAVRRTPLGGLVVRTLDPSPGQTATVRLENQAEQAMKLGLVSGTLAGLDVEIREVSAGQIYEVVGRTTKVMRHGVTRGTLVFSTGLEREARVSVPVTIQVMKLVDPVPAVVFLEPRTSTQPVQRTVNLNYYGTKDDFRVTGATCKQASEVKIQIGPALAPTGGMEALTPKIKSIVSTQVPLPAASGLPAGGWVIEYTTNDPACAAVEVIVTSDHKTWQDLLHGSGLEGGGTSP